VLACAVCRTDLHVVEGDLPLFYERQVRSVTGSTRADGEALRAEAARIPIRPETTPFGPEDANHALELLKRGGLVGLGSSFNRIGFSSIIAAPGQRSGIPT